MAEYKNGVNSFGVMSVEKDDTSSDIQTGRAVYVDDDKYIKDLKYRKRVDQYVAEGFHRISDSGSHSSGGGILSIKLDHREVVDGVSRSYYDHTWREVYNALLDGSYPCFIDETATGVAVIPLTFIGTTERSDITTDTAYFSDYNNSSTVILFADSDDGYLYADDHLD